jgi:hypothetical protein
LSRRIISKNSQVDPRHDLGPSQLSGGVHAPALTMWRVQFSSVGSFEEGGMTKNRKLVPWAIGLGIVLIVIAIVYFAEPAGSLPSFFPGHEAGSSHHHVKHGILALILGVGCFVFAWFQTGPTSRAPASG